MRFTEVNWVKLIVLVTLLIGALYLAVTYPLRAAADQPTPAPNRVQRFSDNSIVDGSSSTLQRNANGLSMTLRTSGLPGGHAFTNWWVFFNNPEYCSDNECGEDDLPPFNRDADPAIAASVCFAAGNVVGDNGVGNFGAARKVKDGDSACLFGPGLLDAKKAEVHIVVRSHGPKDPHHMPAQINSIDGGCSDGQGGFVDVTPAVPGPGECSDLQFAIHLP